MENNRAFLEMLKPAKERLTYKSPEEIVKTADVIYDEANKLFKINSLGQTILLTYPSYDVIGELNEWCNLILLHYLDLADSTPLSGEWTSFSTLKDALVRGTKFDHTVAVELEKFFADKSPERIREICDALGAEYIDGRADLCARLSLFPRYPMLLSIWFADDEFPASGRLFVDKMADHYLTIEDDVVAGEFILTVLKEIC